MTPSAHPRPAAGSPWLAIAAGWLVQLGLKTLLPAVVLVAWRAWVLGADLAAPTATRLPVVGEPVWYAMQAAVCIGALAAGALAAALARTRLALVALALVILSLLRTAFEQLPNPLSAPVALVWAGGPCIGLLAGVWLGRRLPLQLLPRSER